jgi:enolase
LPLKIASIHALEILDSRGSPTLRVWVSLNDGTVECASVPSGASTGAREAVELRDGDSMRYAGRGVLKAISSMEATIAPALIGRDPARQAEIDQLLVALDGTPSKSRLGANAILGASMATARAAAKALGCPLYDHLDGANARRLPMPMMNILNGGKHAGNNLDFQEFMVVPVGAPSFSEALRYGVEVYQALKRILEREGHVAAVGDEGGFAPNLGGQEAACDLIVRAIDSAGFMPGKDAVIALDPAASSFFQDGVYRLHRSGGGRMDSQALLRLYGDWIAKYPIVSIEDGFAEDDWEGFRRQTATMGDKIQIVGDDIYVTNQKYINRGMAERTTNAALIKPNQIGTVTETVKAVDLCRTAGWGYVVSHRSGETDDTFIADFTVAMGGGQIKTGAPCRGERVAKYNRLLEIERELGSKAIFENPFQKVSA